MVVLFRRCPKCEIWKSPCSFYPDASKRIGLSSYCRVCQQKRSALKWATSREACQEAHRLYYQEHREKFLGYSRKLRADALERYGSKCACCGEATQEFLGIDHVNNDGEKHRRELAGYGRAIYSWLKKAGYPQDGRFQILCHNCNMAKGLYGACPHQREVDHGRRPGDAAVPSLRVG